ncbi:MAG: phosphoribosyltransferase family protein [Nitrososphaerota archaeon]
MDSKSRIDMLKLRLNAIELLGLLKKKYDYKLLSEMLELPPSILCRYVKGRVLPNKSRSERIISLFSEKMLTEMIKSKITRTEEGFYDLYEVVKDIRLQKLIGKVAFNEFSYVPVNKLLTVAADGIPIAVEVANEFNVDLIIAKQRKDLSVRDCLEEKIIRTPPIIEYLYIPRRAIKRGENVLIVDDLIRSGKTVITLARLTERAGGNIVGVFSIAMIEGMAEKLREELGMTCQIKSIVTLP